MARSDCRSDRGRAILDRLVHNAYRLELVGKSMRENCRDRKPAGLAICKLFWPHPGVLQWWNERKKRLTHHASAFLFLKLAASHYSA